MASTIKLKTSIDEGVVPASLSKGEVAINVSDGVWYYGGASAVQQNFKFGSVVVTGNTNAAVLQTSKIIGQTDEDIVINSDDDIILNVDYDNDAGNQSVIFQDNGTATFSYNVSRAGLDILGSADAYPYIRLQSTSDSSYGAYSYFLKARKNGGGDIQAGEVGDDLGTISWVGYNDGTPAQKNYAAMLGEIADPVTGSEAGNLTLQVASYDGVLTDGLKLLGDTNADGEVDVTIGAGAASTTTVAGTLTSVGEMYAATQINIKNTGASGSGNGGKVKLICDDGAAMGNGHRLGSIDYWGAEDASSTYKAGASISAFADAAWSASENGTRLEFRTTDANADGPDVALTLDSNQDATFAGTLTMGSTATLNNTGVIQVAAQTNITSLGTLTTLSVDDITIDTKSIRIEGDTDDTFTITTGAAGATTLTTVDEAGTDGDLKFIVDGATLIDSVSSITLDVNSGPVNFAEAGTNYANFEAHHAASWMTLYENEGASVADYFAISCAANGASTIKTQDTAGTNADLTFSIDGATIFWNEAAGADSGDYMKLSMGVNGDATFETIDAAGVAAHLSFIADGNVDIDGKTITLDAATAIALEASTTVTGDLTTTGTLSTNTAVYAGTGVDDGVISANTVNGAYQFITFVGNSGSLTTDNWQYPGTNGISNHTWGYAADGSGISTGSSTVSISRTKQMSGIVLPAGTRIVGITGAIRSSVDDTGYVGLFTYSPDYGGPDTVNATLRLLAQSVDDSGGSSVLNDPQFFKADAAFASQYVVQEGDQLLPAFRRGPGGLTQTVIGTFTIIVKY